MLSRLFIAALWLPAGKGLTSWSLFVMFIVFLLLSHVVSCVKCGTRFIISRFLPSFLLLYNNDIITFCSVIKFASRFSLQHIITLGLGKR